MKIAFRRLVLDGLVAVRLQLSIELLLRAAELRKLLEDLVGLVFPPLLVVTRRER